MDYSGYRDWKSWDNLFCANSSEEALFNNEFNSITIFEKDLLDIGFGSGALLDWARRKGARVQGVEVQEELLLAAEGCGVTVWPSIKDIPSDSNFDVISLFDVLEHLSKDEIIELLGQCRRRLNKNGCIVIRVPNCQSHLGLSLQFADPTHISMLSGPILMKILQDSGFESVEYRAASYLVDNASFLLKVKHLIQRFLRFLYRSFFSITWGKSGLIISHNVLVVAK